MHQHGARARRARIHQAKEAVLSSSLSVLLPVYNAQASLSGMAAELLEVLPESTSRFELLLIDDGSLDATGEIAHELSLRYPQVRVLRHATRQGRAAALRTAMPQARGEFVLWCDEGCQLELRDLHKLWRNRDSFDAVVACSSTPGSRPSSTLGENMVQRMRAWRMRISKQRPAAAIVPGYQLLRRQVLVDLRTLPADRRELLTELTRLGYTWQAVEVRPRMPSMSGCLAAFPALQGLRVDAHSPTPPANAGSRVSGLSRLKKFALGE